TLRATDAILIYDRDGRDRAAKRVGREVCNLYEDLRPLDPIKRQISQSGYSRGFHDRCAVSGTG
ncbi:MAG: hypothetical protein AAGL10_16710, partial [Pseudomonadota bacterium]